LTAAPFPDFSWLSKDKAKQKKLLKEQKKISNRKKTFLFEV